MRSRLVALTTYVALATAAAVAMVLPDALSVPSAAAEGAPDAIYITGTVRDFRRTHPDFGTTLVVDAGRSTIQPTLGPQGRPILAGADGAISSTSTFDQWFRDVLGVNTSARHTIVLTNTGDGVYEYDTDTFHPIDGRLLGNEESEHNFHLTYAFSSHFLYDASDRLFVEFEGDDDAWLFIDGTLVMELPGSDAVTRQYVDLDQLGLTHGETYIMHLFLAQRQASGARFHLRTNVPLRSTRKIVASGGFD